MNVAERVDYIALNLHLFIEAYSILIMMFFHLGRERCRTYDRNGHNERRLTECTGEIPRSFIFLHHMLKMYVPICNSRPILTVDCQWCHE